MFSLFKAKKDLQKYIDLHDSDVQVISQLTTRNHELQAIIEHLQAELEYQKNKLEKIKSEIENERHITTPADGERDSGKTNTSSKRTKRNV
jgi:predicted RNase H-like nuclease (RuvC/YqgF family)